MSTERDKMLCGELYYAFTPELTAERTECSEACHIFNRDAALVPRIERINLWNAIQKKPPISADTPEETLDSYPWVEAPFHADYGSNIELGENVYINFNCTILDTCKVTIKSRTLLGPSISLYSGTHPLSASLRNGTRGPELGGPITIEEDCWLGGSVCILPNVTIGRGSVVGAGSVVTKDVPPNSVVAGNPARVLRKLKGDADDKGERVVLEKDVKLAEMLNRLEALEAEVGEVKGKLKELTG